MTIFGIVTVGPAAPMDFGITMAGAAIGQQKGLLSKSRRFAREDKSVKPNLNSPAALDAARTVFVEAAPQGGSIRALFDLAPPDRGTGLQRFAAQCLDPNANGALNWRNSAAILPGGTPFLDCPTNPSEAAVLLSNSGVDVFSKLATSPDLAVVDFGELYHDAPTLDCLSYASFVFVVVTPARGVLARAVSTVTSLLSESLAADKVGFVVRGDAAIKHPDAEVLQAVLPAPITLVVNHDPRGSIGSVTTDRALEKSVSVRQIRTFVQSLLISNGLAAPHREGPAQWSPASSI